MYFVETGGAIAIVGGKVVRKYSRAELGWENTTRGSSYHYPCRLFY